VTSIILSPKTPKPKVLKSNFPIPKSQNLSDQYATLGKNYFYFLELPSV
jgi:hypothetical protein